MMDKLTTFLEDSYEKGGKPTKILISGCVMFFFGMGIFLGGYLIVSFLFWEILPVSVGDVTFFLRALIGTTLCISILGHIDG